ncbi:unannotated protein [freshwater metagenome]
MKPIAVPDGPLGVSVDGSVSITGLDPAVLPADHSFDGASITIYGSGFQPGITVMIGDQECTDALVIDENQLTCDPPNAPISINDVTVTNPDGTAATAPEALEFMDPAGFWTRPVYAYSDNPLLRSLVPPSTVPSESPGAENLANATTDTDALAIPVFTG